jgi:hypothetical protein
MVIKGERRSADGGRRIANIPGWVPPGDIHL